MLIIFNRETILMIRTVGESMHLHLVLEDHLISLNLNLYIQLVKWCCIDALSIYLNMALKLYSPF